MYVRVCVYVRIPIFSLYIFFCPIYVSVYLSIYLSVYLPLWPSILPSLFPPTLLFTYSQYLSIRSVCSQLCKRTSPPHSLLVLCLSAHPHTLPYLNYLLPTHQFNVKLILPPPSSSTPSCPYTLEYIKTEWVGVAVTLLIRTRGMLGSDVGQAILTKAFRNFPQSLSENSATAITSSFKIFPNLHSPVILPPDAVQSV
jgi:hypothetical protein